MAAKKRRPRMPEDLLIAQWPDGVMTVTTSPGVAEVVKTMGEGVRVYRYALLGEAAQHKSVAPKDDA